MYHVRSKMYWGALAAITAGVVGCTATDSAGGRPATSRTEFAAEWASAIHDMGRYPIVPPSEDVYVGDVFASSVPPSTGTAESANWLRMAATPRWKSLQVLGLLDAEYRQRPTWYEATVTRHRPASADPATGAASGGDTLYSADHVPLRHRIVGLRSMANLTVDVPDLEPFIPVEIAPLIEGPATPERYAVSLQAGEAESYSLSLHTLLEALVDSSVAAGATRYTLKQEHLGNLSLVADQNVGKVYLMVITEVLYIRSIEATVRARYTAADGEMLDGAPAVPEPTVPEPVRDDSAVEAIRRANAMNDAFGTSGIEDRIGGTVRVVMVTEGAITLRRSWPYPLAVGVRGLTLEVDVSNGDVVRMGPLGIDLPELPPPSPPSPPSPQQKGG